MLIQFNFKNYKSYKDENSLDMTATSIKEHPYNLILLPNGEEYIKTAAIYGANASGKSGVIEAFAYMANLVLSSLKKESEGKGIPIKRFAFDKLSRNGKSEFEVFFRHKDKEYQYGFVVDNKKVHEEWLYKRDFRSKYKYNTLFERKDDKIHCTNLLRGAEKFVDHVEDSTLFLSLIAILKISDAKVVYNWFFNTEVIDFSHSFFEDFMTDYITEKAFEDKDFQHAIVQFLKAVDVGIEGIRIEKLKRLSNNDDSMIYKVYSQHKTTDGSSIVEIPFTEESGGTQKMFCLFHFIYETIKEGSTIFIDELDAKLHPLLLRYVINMFHNPEINKNNAQLIYTTHDMYTLTRDIFRRDQIWFSEKDSSGVSKLYSLAEFKLEGNKKVRNDASYSKDYISGRYGAVPLLKEFKILGD